MEAATSHSARVNTGTYRLLAHCAGLVRVESTPRASARARLERELGGDFARQLVGALVPEGRPRSTPTVP